MDAVMEKSFEALETALNQLVESISSYYPSPAAASAVVIADNGIQESLVLLAEHQANHHKIQTLRATSEALDQRLAQLLTVLSQTRKELLAVPSTTFPPSRQIPYDELLTYARKISKYTQPPSSRSLQAAQQQQSITAAAADISNSNSSIPGESSTASTRPDLGLTEQEVAALDPSSSRVAFTPWPSEEVMRRGALAQLAFQGEGIVTNNPQDILLAQQAQNGANGGLGVDEVRIEEPEGPAGAQVNGHLGAAAMGAEGAQVHAAYPPRDIERERRAKEAQYANAWAGVDLFTLDED
ncbi:vitamin-D-receptor interacting mediator subunit 4-domain-containing protein [Kalaharituber pfeilii]|nr:vitamin-D-receptor interacting mediator subunit 4-domain-containing protein [Kalaharituber pfeilii]